MNMNMMRGSGGKGYANGYKSGLGETSELSYSLL